jgi:predicted phage tail protein
MANLNSISFANILDLISEGEIEGLKDGKKSIFFDNVELLNRTAIVKSGTYNQASGITTITSNSHGYAVNNSLAIDITSGGGISGTYIVKTSAANTFTLDARSQVTASGNVTISRSADYNFQDVTVISRNGTNDQLHIGGNNETSEEIAVGVKVLKDTPVVRTITDQVTNAVRVTLGFPRLQSFQNDGGVGGSSVQIKIDVQYGGTGFSNVIDDTVTGRADDNYQKDYIVNLDGAFPVDIRVTRVTADSIDPKIANECNWTSYTQIVYGKLRYPNSALVSLRFPSEQFSSIPQRSFLIRGIKIDIPSNGTVDNTNGAVIYSGAWNGLFGNTKQWTSDPAWCLWALLTNTRFGLGDYLNTALLDKWSFYQASRYASALDTYTSAGEIAERGSRGLQPRSGATNDYDETTGRHGVPDGFGNYEPRFSCNINIQSSEEAYTAINNLCSVFRGMPFWSAGSLTVSQDRPVASSYLFTPANISEEGFSYSGSSQKARATVVIVSYFDTTMRTMANEYVEDQAAIAKYGVNTKKIEAFACTSRGQAHRLGLWMLYAESRETEIVAFTASIDSGVIVRPGQVIDVADPVRADSRRGGRISSATTSIVTVDDATGLTTANSPTLSVILPDGSVETRPVTPLGINGNNIEVSSAFSAAPNNNSIWIFQDNDMQTTQWRVISVTEQDECEYVINALSYNSSKYDTIEYGVALTDRDITNLNELPAAPTNISFIESLYSYQAEIRSKLVIGWLPVVGVNQYQIKWRKDYGNWSIITLQGVDYEILSTTPGLYEAEIYSVNAIGKQSLTALVGSVQALGKTAPPSDVQIFTAAIDPSVGVTLNWNAITDLDLQGYEIWQGPSWGSGMELGVFNATSKKLGLIGLGTTTWWIKALDTSGSYSANAISASLTVTAANTPTISGAFSNDSLILNWSAVVGSLSTAYYEVRYGDVSDAWETATVLGTVQGTTLSIKGAWVGTRRFFLAAVDLKGNVGGVATYDGVVIAPSLPTIQQQVIDNNVLLQWTDATQTLPIIEYELRKGSTWATATVIGTKQGKFTTVFETNAGTYTYWIAGIDSAGNYGIPGDVSAPVSQPPDYVLKLDQNSTFAGTKTNLGMTSLGLLASINTTETWEQHFTTARAGYPSGWTTPQNQINAGFPIYVMPSQSNGQYYEDIDYGAVLAGTKVTTTLTSDVISGVTTITPTISIKKLVGDPWIVYSGVTSIFGSDFRYIRTQYDFTSSGNNNLLEITALNTRLDSKIRSDSGNGTASATDSGGTVVNFALTPGFVDVDSITVTPAGVTAVTAVYDFTDVPNPTFFKVLLFNPSGVRINGAFSWSARGV